MHGYVTSPATPPPGMACCWPSPKPARRVEARRMEFMTPAIVLQVKFNFEVPMDEFERLSEEVAPVIAQVPGLRWKLWLTDEAERIHSGVYLFEDEASLRAYLDGPVMDDLRRNPHMRNVEMKVYAIDDVRSAITRAPVGRQAP